MPGSPDGPLLLVVLLYARPGQELALRRFEERALAIARENGATLVAAQSPRRVAGADFPPPTEVHVLTFPSADALAAYRADPRLEALAEQRATAIERTVIISGGQVEYEA